MGKPRQCQRCGVPTKELVLVGARWLCDYCAWRALLQAAA
jgi:hypothetical protein